MSGAGERRVGLLAALAGAVLISGATWRAAPRGEGPDMAPTVMRDGTPYVGVNGLARLLDATKFWRADLRKLVLRSERHSITLTVDDPFVVVDDSTLWLPAPVRSAGGELQVPAALVAALPPDSTRGRLTFDRHRARIVALPAAGAVGSPTITASAAATRLVFPVEQPDDAVVVGRSRARFRLRFAGLFTGALPANVPPGSLLSGAHQIAASGGSAFEFEVAPEAAAFRLTRDGSGRRVVLELLRESVSGAEAFAPEDAGGPRPLRVIVLDPGHGGNDPGVVAGGVVEKDLALALAVLLKRELGYRLSARVVLTRSDDRDLSADERAEIANRARADLMLTLHFDGLPAARARGATAYCPPPVFVDAAGAGPERIAGASASRPIQPLAWRDVALRHSLLSRSLAEAIGSALELRGQGPVRLRERLPVALLGVNAPGLLLECATLSSPADRERVKVEARLRELAASIAEGILAWQRNK